MSGVYCGKCKTILLADHEKIRAHYLREHRTDISADEIKNLKSHSARKKKKAKKKKSHSFWEDPDFQHEERWRTIIQGGAPGSGKKR